MRGWGREGLGAGAQGRGREGAEGVDVAFAHRLVVDTLERRWNAVLERVTEVEQRLAAGAAEGPPRPAVDREQLLALARDFPAVWRHPRTDIQLKKRLVRLLVEEIVVTVTAELWRRAPGVPEAAASECGSYVAMTAPTDEATAAGGW